MSRKTVTVIAVFVYDYMGAIMPCKTILHKC